MRRYSRCSRNRTKTHDKATISHDISHYSRYQTAFPKLEEIISTFGRIQKMLNFGWAFFIISCDELRSSYIRLQRVILLRSDIWLSPSDIRFASFGGEYNTTVNIICNANLWTIPLRAKRVISLRSNITIWCKFGASLLIVGTHAKKVFTNSSFYDIIIKTKRVGKLACQRASADCSSSVLRLAKQSA